MSAPAPMLLCVDDDPDMRALISSVLRREGYAVDVAADAREAVEQLRSQNYDTVLLDIEMPGMSGLDLLRLLRDTPAFLNYQNVPVIIVTGKDGIGTMAESFSAGAVFFLEKPFTLTELSDAVRLVLHVEK